MLDGKLISKSKFFEFLKKIKIKLNVEELFAGLSNLVPSVNTNNKKYVQYHFGMQNNPQILKGLLGPSSLGRRSSFLPALPMLISDLMDEMVSFVYI